MINPTRMNNFEQPKSQEREEESSFLRRHIKKITAILMPLGIAVTVVVGREYKKNQYLEAMREEMGSYSLLISETKKGDEWKTIERIWEDPSTGKRKRVETYKDNYGKEHRSYQDIITEEEKTANEQRRQAELENQRLAEEQQVQEQERQTAEIKEKAKERLGAARELMYPYEYKETEMQELMREAKEIYGFAGEATPEAIKEFLQSEGKDLIGLAHQIDENTAWNLAEQMVKNPQRNYQGWENYQQIPNIEEKLENIIKYTLPKGWANYNVRNIIFESEGSYIGDFKKETNTLSIGGAGLSEIIKIQAEVDRESEVINPKDEIEKTFVHEYIHAAGDPEFSDNVPLGLKIKLEKMKQGFWKKCFKSGFNIPTEDLEKRKLFNAHEAREALAHIMGDYLKDPALKDRNNRASSPERRDFCENYLKTMDPDFDASKAAELREKILQGWKIIETTDGSIFSLPPENR